MSRVVLGNMTYKHENVELVLSLDWAKRCQRPCYSSKGSWGLYHAVTVIIIGTYQQVHIQGKP